VALEASACGIPVVASAVGGLTTLVDHGRTGFLVDDRDPKVFADYTARVLADRDLAQTMGAAAVHRAQGYTWAGAGAQLRRRYAELTSRSLVQCR
jgi:D-inositol-3-phosphate glycosyltransferase